MFLCISGQNCIEEQVSPVEYITHYDCISDGYIRSYSSLMKLGVDVVEKNKFIVKFKCVGVKGENIWQHINSNANEKSY